MNEITVETIREAIADSPDPETGRPLASMGQIKDVSVQDGAVSVTIGLASHSMPIIDDVTAAIEAKIAAAAPGSNITVTIVDHPRPPARLGQIGLRAKSVIAVGSGKGGVGKSTVAASIALTLRRLGAKVGLMDADVYGPSIPHLLGLIGRPAITADKKIEPIRLIMRSAGASMPVMSMGFLGRTRSSGDLARSDVARFDQSVPERHRLGRTRLLDHRHAARHRRRCA